MDTCISLTSIICIFTIQGGLLGVCSQQFTIDPPFSVIYIQAPDPINITCTYGNNNVAWLIGIDDVTVKGFDTIRLSPGVNAVKTVSTIADTGEYKCINTGGGPSGNRAIRIVVFTGRDDDPQPQPTGVPAAATTQLPDMHSHTTCVYAVSPESGSNILSFEVGIWIGLAIGIVMAVITGIITTVVLRHGGRRNLKRTTNEHIHDEHTYDDLHMHVTPSVALGQSGM